MYRAFAKVKNNKKGFTLVELLITMTILLLALVLTCELFGMIYKNYRIVEGRWVVQSEVQYIMTSFQVNSNNESLTTANFVDIYYEPNMDTGITVGSELTCLNTTDSSGTVTNSLGALVSEDETTHALTFQKADDENTYLFSYKHYFYYLNRGETVAHRYSLNTLKDGDKDYQVPIDIYFDVAVKANNIDAATGRESKVVSDSKYLPKGISITVASTKGEAGYFEGLGYSVYKLNTSFDFDNMNQGQKINITGGTFSNTSVAGWTGGNLKYLVGNFDDDKTDLFETGKSATDYQYLTEHGNIVKYVSSNAYFAQANAGNSGASTNFNCATRWLMAGSKLESPVINTLRDFRNNVLKGTAIGDFIIEKYYDWSPAVIEAASNSKILKGLLKAFVVPAAAVAFCVSE